MKVAEKILRKAERATKKAAIDAEAVVIRVAKALAKKEAKADKKSKEDAMKLVKQAKKRKRKGPPAGSATPSKISKL